MKYTNFPLLSTDVSRLGLGTVKIGRNTGVKYPAQFDLPDDKTVLNLLNIAQDTGINLIDTAPAYGASEQRLGELVGPRLNDWIIISKAGEEFINGKSFFDFSEQYIKFSVNRSLKRLRRDYLDILLIHSNGDDTKIIEQNEIFVTLDKLKQHGVIRMGGISSKTVAGGIASLNHADCVMATYNPIMTDEESVLDHAEKLQKPIFIKKAFCSGHTDKIASSNPIEHAAQFIFSHPAKSHIIAGTINPQHLLQNAALI